MKKQSLFILASIFLAGCADEGPDKDLKERHREIDSLTSVIEKRKTVTDSLSALLAEKDTSSSGGYPIFYGKKYEGIENPKEFIENQLRNQPDKIPISPVLGGQMEFRKIDILTEKWLLAIYDDGHVQGKAIMEYALQPDGSVKYTIVATQE